MTNQLRGDEEFVIRSVANAFSWRAGENPPDAYLTVEVREVVVEISTLMENQSDGRGGTRSRLSDDGYSISHRVRYGTKGKDSRMRSDFRLENTFLE
jgi:hypothetical protein